MGVIQDAATTGFSNAQAYDTHRPSYPATAVETLLSHLGVAGKPRSKVIDLAAGTGKFTELLARRDEQYDIFAVEPHKAMRQTMVDKNLRGVEVREGTAEKMDVPDGWADAVVVAQAFHWFSNETALKEIHRVLKPDGKLAMIWNIENYNKPRSWTAETQWEQTLNELVHDLAADGTPRFREFIWKEVFKNQDVNKPLFATPLGNTSESWTVRLGTGALWDRVSTLSQVAVLKGEDGRAFRTRFDQILKEGDGDWNQAGEVATHGITYFTWTTRV